MHYALVARLSEHWRLPTNDDPSLEEMNFYPRYSHRLAAISGRLLGSPLEGMQFVALVSLTALWSGFALIFHSLPLRMRWLLLGWVAVLLLANREFFIHLELFGNELLNNYFFPQLVAQAAVILVVACVLWMERTGLSPVASYLVLGICSPVIEQFHLLPALEMLAILALLVIINNLDARIKNPRTVAILGLLICLGSISLTALTPVFARMLSISETNGLLKLNYTAALTASCLGVHHCDRTLGVPGMAMDAAGSRTGTKQQIGLQVSGPFGLGYCQHVPGSNTNGKDRLRIRIRV